IYGFAAIALFMCLYYLLFGVISTISLAVNLLLLIAVLSMLQATLTLRGVANPQAAINTGYERAFATILDSNVTTLIAGLALLAFGSGPIRAFAIVHCL